MIQSVCMVESVEEIGHRTFEMFFRSPEIADSVLPGQFVNIRGWSSFDPLLRRPFSVYRKRRESVSVVFDVVGRGTGLMSRLRAGDRIDVIGPLGRPFTYTDQWDTAVLVAGGLGVAPFPLLTRAIEYIKKPVLTCLGARSSNFLLPQNLTNVVVSTDDGSSGFHGNVIELVRGKLAKGDHPGAKLFGCGPTAMLRGLASLAEELNVPCELSLEGPMGCGFGICQGCPVRLRGEPVKYALMCKDGPVFPSNSISL